MGWLHAVNSGKGAYISHLIVGIDNYNSFVENLDFSSFNISAEILSKVYPDYKFTNISIYKKADIALMRGALEDNSYGFYSYNVKKQNMVGLTASELRKLVEKADEFECCAVGCLNKIFSNEYGYPFEAFKSLMDTVRITGCLTHCRRYYTKVLKAMREFKKLPPEEKKTVPAYVALCKLKEIFNREKKLSGLTPKDRLARRQKDIGPLMNDFFHWADSFKEGDFDKGGLMEKALNYSRNQRRYLEQFLKDGAVPIHNSASEQSIIPLCIGRNNCLRS